MITAVDASVLIDVFTDDATFGGRSRGVLVEALAEGMLIACDVVWAEVSAAFRLSEAPWPRWNASGWPSCFSMSRRPAAGARWRLYRERGGTRERVIADFLIGAHACVSADRLLTRDRGFYRSYFGDLKILDPSSG